MTRKPLDAPAAARGAARPLAPARFTALALIASLGLVACRGEPVPDAEPDEAAVAQADQPDERVRPPIEAATAEAMMRGAGATPGADASGDPAAPDVPVDDNGWPVIDPLDLDPVFTPPPLLDPAAAIEPGEVSRILEPVLPPGFVPRHPLDGTSWRCATADDTIPITGIITFSAYTYETQFYSAVNPVPAIQVSQLWHQGGLDYQLNNSLVRAVMQGDRLDLRQVPGLEPLLACTRHDGSPLPESVVAAADQLCDASRLAVIREGLEAEPAFAGMIALRRIADVCPDIGILALGHELAAAGDTGEAAAAVARRLDGLWREYCPHVTPTLLADLPGASWESARELWRLCEFERFSSITPDDIARNASPYNAVAFGALIGALRHTVASRREAEAIARYALSSGAPSLDPPAPLRLPASLDEPVSLRGVTLGGSADRAPHLETTVLVDGIGMQQTLRCDADPCRVVIAIQLAHTAHPGYPPPDATAWLHLLTARYGAPDEQRTSSSGERSAMWRGRAAVVRLTENLDRDGAPTWVGVSFELPEHP